MLQFLILAQLLTYMLAYIMFTTYLNMLSIQMVHVNFIRLNWIRLNWIRLKFVLRIIYEVTKLQQKKKILLTIIYKYVSNERR